MTALFSDYESTKTNHQTLNAGQRTGILQEYLAGGAGKNLLIHISYENVKQKKTVSQVFPQFRTLYHIVSKQVKNQHQTQGI